MQETRANRFRFLVVFLCLLECLSITGVIFGWASVVYVLKAEGFFLDLCNVTLGGNGANAGGTIVTCDERDLQFSILFAVAFSAQALGAFMIGRLQMAAGNRVARVAVSLIFLSGCYIVAFTSLDSPWLLYPGLSLAGTGAIATIMLCSQTSVLFRRAAPIVVGIMNGAADSCTGLQFLVKMSYEAGISRQSIYLFMGSLALLTLPCTFLLIPRGHLERPPSADHKDTGREEHGAVEYKGEYRRCFMEW
ncbi:solute carrier family 43 member 3 [Aplysia californica]|uniref:Solute carrier family 43 member 3 n=1 Tax=Aplysia californica TaxID=6500 RepID=A0ABM0K2E2_APLCA|nr:solute carrier family 43 member 3 [Aplysia californica]